MPIGAPTAGTTSGIGGGLSNVDSMIDSLMQRLQLPQEQPVQKTPVVKKITAAISDALMARAQVLAGGVPTGAGARERQRQEEELQRQRNEQIRQERTQVKRAVTMDVFGQERKRQDALMKQAADDAEAAKKEAKESQKLKLQEREEVIDQWSSLLDMPGFAQWWQSVNPGVVDLNTLDLQKITRIKQKYMVEAGFDAKRAEILSMLDTAARTKPPEGMELSSVQAGGLRFDRPKKEELPTGALTPVTARQAMNAGVVTTGMDEAQAREAVAAAKQQKESQRQKERKERLNKKTVRGGTVLAEIEKLKDIERNIAKALDFVVANPDVGGPVAGNRFTPGLAIRIKDYVAGTNDLSLQYQKADLLGAIRTAVRNAISGTAVSEAEAKELETILPNLKDWDDKVLVNLKNGLTRARAAIASRQKEFGLTDDDMDFIRDPNYVRPPEDAYQPGDLRLGSH